MIRKSFFALMVAMACTEERSVSSHDLANTILDQVIVAAGGDSALANIGTLVAQYEFSQISPAGEMLPPIEVLQVRDFITGRNLYEVHTNTPTETWERVVMAPGRTFSVNMLTNEFREFDTPAAAMADYSELQLRWYAYQPILQAQAGRTNLRHLGDSVIDGVHHDIISYLHHDLGEIRLGIDRPESRLRSQSWNVPGAVSRRMTLRYQAYADVDGVPMPMVVIVADGGQDTARYDISGIEINVMLQESAFRLPESS